MSGNQALNTNQAVSLQADLAITERASDWYFTVCAIMTVATMAFMGMSMGQPRGNRLFHYITAGITMVAAIAYFTMGAGLGQVPILAEFMRPYSSQVGAAGTREIFYVRYIDWFVTTPLLLLDLLLTAGLPTATILITILADEVMIVTGLVGALTNSSYKWGYFVFGMLAFLFVFYQVAIVGLPAARALGAQPGSVYLRCGVLTLGVWFLYPIAWGISEGGNVIHPDGEAIFYGILDVIAKPVFGAMLIMGHRNILPADLGLNIRESGPGAGVGTEKRSNGFFGRKHAAGTDGHVANNTTTTTTV
uniref:Rhodopsin n=1 Tax=Araucaria cunninghamii TaxID=56994 RepID=A0A0D6R250_ARACU